MQAAPAEQMRYTRTARNEVHRQFQRLPDPDLVMYVYPHLAGTDPGAGAGLHDRLPAVPAHSVRDAGRARGGLLMRWKLPWPKPAALKLAASGAGDDEQPDGWQRHVEALRQAGIPEPGSAVRGRKPATVADEQALYEVAPSFVELLPWVEFLPESKAMLLEDGQSVAAFFELVPLGTEGRELAGLRRPATPWRTRCRTRFDELDENPWVLQLYAQDEPSFDQYMQTLRDYVQPRARDTAFSRVLPALLRPPPARGGQARRPVRGHGGHAAALARPDAARAHGGLSPCAPGKGNSRRGQTPEQMLNIVCDRLCGGLANAGIQARRMVAADVHDWLLRWFNPRPTLLGPGAEDRERFYALARYPEGRRTRGRRDRTGERAGFQPAAVLRPAALRRGARHLVFRRHAAPRADHRPPAHAARHGTPDRRDPQGRCDQHAVRPDARGHLALSDDGRHAPGRPGIGSEPPGEEGRGRDAGVGADAQGRA